MTGAGNPAQSPYRWITLIAPLAGSSSAVPFGPAAICFALLILPALFLPELGSRALAARAAGDSAM
jgi:hypothetical protein